MANNLPQYQQVSGNNTTATTTSNNTTHHCKECGIYLNSAESLEVHLRYHKENLLNKWASQAAGSTATSGSDETNNNSATQSGKAIVQIKREFISSSNAIAAAADSSDGSIMLQKKSPEYGSGHRTTPENSGAQFGHPPTPQSYHSSSSPYQTPDNSAFSPGFQSAYGHIKQERSSPNTIPYAHQTNYHPSFHENQAFFMDAASGNYPQDFPIHKMHAQNPFIRYHPYAQHPGAPHIVTSSSPAYPPQPTPSPSPKQCDKCGYVCESASQLIDHINVAHPPSAAHLNSFQQHPSQQAHAHQQQQTQSQHQQQHFLFNHPRTEIKTEDDPQSEILDLDSQKVVHPIYPEEEKRINGELNDPHRVFITEKLFQPTTQASTEDQKPFQQQPPPIQQQQQQQEPKIFQPHPVVPNSFMQNGGAVTTTTTSVIGSPQHTSTQPQTFNRVFEQHANMSVAAAAAAAAAATPLISSTQGSTVPPTQIVSHSKGTNWKSNEARRPKTYNCTACNKWFTSSGHLKRHYNTTLHKNAVKSSGHPDPASLPISAHHHPTRDSAQSRDEMMANQHHASNSPTEDSDEIVGANFDRHLQQPPSGPYDRQQPPGPPNILHSPMGPPTAATGMNNSQLHSPPNGEAGLSLTTTNPRGLLNSTSPTPHHLHQSTAPTELTPSVIPQHHLLASQVHHHQPMGPVTLSSNPPGFPLAPPPPTMEQMYPNEFAPHVTPIMATTINNHSIIGEHEHQQYIVVDEEVAQLTQPLPSFAQFAAGHRGLLLGYYAAANSNVGGLGPVTAPYTSTYIFTGEEDLEHEEATPPDMDFKADDFKLTIMTDEDETSDNQTDNLLMPYSPANHNNNITLMDRKMQIIENLKMRFETQPASPEKAKIKRDFEEGAGSPKISSTTIKSRPKKTKASKSPPLSPSVQLVHKCFDCDKVFNKSCYLTQHNKTFHCGDKPFKCSRCGKRFSFDDQFQEHLSKHAGEKPHKCDLCPKQFNHKTDLRRHMCLHTGQKPYPCITCGKGFIRKDHMLKHYEIHTKKPTKILKRLTTPECAA